MDRQAGPAFPRGLGTKTHGHAAESETQDADVLASPVSSGSTVSDRDWCGRGSR